MQDKSKALPILTPKRRKRTELRTLPNVASNEPNILLQPSV